jgi:hypothetical protein
MGRPLHRMATVVAPVVLGAAVMLWVGAGTAAASVSGPCTAELNGTSVTTGHETAGTAIHVDYRSNAQYKGEATDGQTVGDAQVTIEVSGLKIRRQGGSTNGPQWADTIDVKKYAWAGIGLYRVSGVAVAGSGAPICTGTAFMCVDGKPFLFTVAGAVAALLGLYALFLLVRGVMVSRWRSRVRVAYRFGGAGLLGGIAVPVLLQQSCVLPLTETIALASLGGGLIGMVLIGLLVGGRGRRVRSPLPPITAAAPPRERQRNLVYRFLPNEEACTTCREHAAHRTYRTAEAAVADRAHEDCVCEVAPEVPKDPFLVERFAGRDVIDDREG